jgi:hypothetical protein
MQELYDELLQRQKILESEEFTQQSLGRQKELNLIILKVQKLILSDGGDVLAAWEEFKKNTWYKT